MSMRIILALMFILVNLAVAIWDLYVQAIGKPTDTVSYVFQQWGRDWPVLPLLIGVVIGHVFWPTRPQ